MSKNKFKIQSRYDITNQQMGNWKVICLIRIENQATIWKCQCLCGYIKNMRRNELTKAKLENRQNCWKCAAINKRNTITGFRTRHFTRIKLEAQNRKIEFQLTEEYLRKLFIQQKERCIFSNELIYFSISAIHKFTTASLDRIDSSKGYIKGNVQWVHKDVNRMKQNLTDQEFIELCKLVTEYNS